MDQQNEGSTTTKRFTRIDPCAWEAPAPLRDLNFDDYLPFVDPARIETAFRLAEVVGIGEGLHVFQAAEELQRRWAAGEFEQGDKQFHDDLYCAYRSRRNDLTAAEWAVTKAAVFGLADPALPADAPRNATFGAAFNDVVATLVEYDRGRKRTEGGNGYDAGSQQARRVAADEASRRLRLELQQSVTDFTARLVDEMGHRVDNDLALLSSAAVTRRVSDTEDLWGVVNGLVPGGVRSSDFGRQVALLKAEGPLFDWLALDVGLDDDKGTSAFHAAVHSAVVIDAQQRELAPGTRTALTGG